MPIINGVINEVRPRTVIGINGAAVPVVNGVQSTGVDKWRMAWNGNHFAPPEPGSVLWYPGVPGQGSVIQDFAESYADSGIDTDEELDDSETGVDCDADATTACPIGSIIVVDSEKMYVSATGTTLTVARGYNGTVAAAHSTNANIWVWIPKNGTIVNATWVQLPSGLPVLNFDGDDYVNIDVALNNLAATTKGTWMAWINLVDATPIATGTPITFGDTNATEYIFFGLLGTTGLLRGELAVAGTQKWQVTTDAVALSDGVYAHIALIQDGTSPILLVNGVQVAQTLGVQVDKTLWFSGCAGLDNGRIGCININSGGNTAFIVNGRKGLITLINTNLTVAQVLSIVQQERHLFNV
uniref:Putative lectin/glucanase superfamily protein n=1 Tax=viral metagenome TaxID=1070528 RepID=A0A6M3L3F8_9ZZZZ